MCCYKDANIQQCIYVRHQQRGVLSKQTRVLNIYSCIAVGN